jgi:mono/diheme cytochrome c family protein
MPYKFQSDTELEKSTNRVTVWGVVLMVALAAAFPLYRWVEPTGRTDARAQQLESLAEQGGDLWSISCSSCHGLAGEGLTAPALNSTQFRQSTT